MPTSAPPARVLVADDQSDVVFALRLVLREAGIDVDAANSVQEVRAKLDGQHYDLVLMDLNYARDTTSGQEGLDLLRDVHARDALLPVIVMTGWGSIDSAVEAMRLGARSYVRKPWDNAALAAAVRREVAHGRTVRRADTDAARQQVEARAIQQALLPTALPVVPGGTLAARWRAASAFGGDAYDALPLSDARVGLCIADVCGKGLPAAFLMANVQASLRAFAGSGQEPAQVMASLNRALCGNAGLRRFVTCVYGIYDTATRQLAYCNGGHNPPVLVRADGSVTRLSDGGMVTGIGDDAAYAQGSVQLASGDRLVLFTDGISEAESPAGDDFGESRLVAIVRAHRGPDADALVEAIFDAVAAFTGGPLQDDQTALALVMA